MGDIATLLVMVMGRGWRDFEWVGKSGVPRLIGWVRRRVMPANGVGEEWLTVTKEER